MKEHLELSYQPLRLKCRIFDEQSQMIASDDTAILSVVDASRRKAVITRLRRSWPVTQEFEFVCLRESSIIWELHVDIIKHLLGCNSQARSSQINRDNETTDLALFIQGC